MSIQRYILGDDRSLPSKNGFYVTYKDHQSEIARLTNTINDLNDYVDTYQDASIEAGKVIYDKDAEIAELTKRLEAAEMAAKARADECYVLCAEILDLKPRLEEAHKRACRNAAETNAQEERAEAAEITISNLSSENQRLKNGVSGDLAEIDRIQKEYDGVFRKYIQLKNKRKTAELNAARYEWINVKEKLPLIGYVIAYRPSAPKGNEVSTINYDYYQKRFCGQYPVTHWMPLPISPEEAARLAQGESK